MTMQKFINYKHYNIYKGYKMETTTIAVSREVRAEIVEFGNKGETYSEILQRLLKSAKERQLHDLLMSEEGTIPIEKALASAKNKWHK
jgi:predicted CopG family antitoxin